MTGPKIAITKGQNKVACPNCGGIISFLGNPGLTRADVFCPNPKCRRGYTVVVPEEQCSYCGRSGHKRSACPKQIADEREKRAQAQAEVRRANDAKGEARRKDEADRKRALEQTREADRVRQKDQEERRRLEDRLRRLERARRAEQQEQSDLDDSPADERARGRLRAPGSESIAHDALDDAVAELEAAADDEGVEADDVERDDQYSSEVDRILGVHHATAVDLPSSRKSHSPNRPSYIVMFGGSFLALCVGLALYGAIAKPFREPISPVPVANGTVVATDAASTEDGVSPAVLDAGTPARLRNRRRERR